MNGKLVRYTLLLLLVAATHFASAQEFKPLLIVGVNASQIDGDTLSGYDKGGIYAGIGLMYGIGKKSMLHTEITYSQKGARNKSTDDFILIYRLNYIAIPILFSTKVHQSGILMEGGVGNAILVGQHFDFNGFVAKSFPAPIKNIDHTFIIGAEFPVIRDLTFNLRFNYSIFPVSERPAFFNNYLTLTLRFYPSGSIERN